MSKKSAFTIGAVVIALLLLFSLLATGEEVSDKLSNVIRTRLGLNSDVYRVIETEYQGEKVILIAIYGSDKALKSSLGDDIKSGLRENMDQSPVALSVLTMDEGVKFHPYALRVLQGDETKRPKNMIGITNGFKDGEMPEKVPIEGEVFWGSKGIITMGEDFDPTTPFSVKYGTTSADFSPKSTVSQEPTEVTTEEEPATGDSGLKATEPETGGNGEVSEESTSNSGSAVSNSKTGQGLALLTQLATLLSITLSFL